MVDITHLNAGRYGMNTRRVPKTACFFSIVFFSFLSCSTVSDIATNLMVSDAQEVQLGTQYRQQIEDDKTNYPLYTQRTSYNTNLVNYIETIGQKIVSNQNDRTGIEFKFTVINNDSVINAFAIPGGFVYVYTGLLIKASNEAEIAGVLAHEIAHVAKRHGAKRLVREYGIDALLDVLVGDSSGIRLALDITKNLVFLDYGRDNEFESDSCAVEYLTSAGYNPNGMKTFLEVLATMGGSSSKLEQLLSTHPDSKDRVARVERIINRKSDTIKNRSIPGKAYNP
jgi:beta-barrel assembly-enhancing protease